MLIEPRRIRNCLLFVSPVSVEPITAACDEPREGRIVQSGAENMAASEEFAISFLFIFMSLSFVIFCFGILLFFIMLVIREEEPNKPVSNGKSDCLMLRLSVEMPRKPARKKMNNAQSLDFSSLRIRNIEEVMRTRNIAGFMYVYACGRMMRKSGVKIRIIGIAIRLPYNV